MSTLASTSPKSLPRLLLGAVVVTGAIDLLIGIAFFFGPELGGNLWPTPIAPVLMRFIGAILLANGIGGLIAARQGTWEGLRALLTVALVYGVLVFLALLFHLVAKPGTPTVFWIYAAVDAVFLIPIIYVFWTQEQAFRARRTSG